MKAVCSGIPFTFNMISVSSGSPARDRYISKPALNQLIYQQHLVKTIRRSITGLSQTSDFAGFSVWGPELWRD